MILAGQASFLQTSGHLGARHQDSENRMGTEGKGRRAPFLPLTNYFAGTRKENLPPARLMSLHRTHAEPLLFLSVFAVATVRFLLAFF